MDRSFSRGPTVHNLRHRTRVAAAVVTLVLANALLAASVFGYVPYRTYLGQSTYYLYKPAPTTLCSKLLRIAPTRISNPIGCRFRAAVRREFFSDAVVGWTWNDYRITFSGPFDFWRASSEITAHFNGSSIWADANTQRCLSSGAFVKVEVTSCRNWKVNAEVAHEVDFKVTYDSIPLVTLSNTYWAQQRVNKAGNAWANIFGP